MGQTFKAFAGGDINNITVIGTSGDGDAPEPDDLLSAGHPPTPVVPRGPGF